VNKDQCACIYILTNIDITINFRTKEFS